MTTGKTFDPTTFYGGVFDEINHATVLLPLTRNATPLEIALARVNERIQQIDADEIRRSKDPNKATARFLPLLAWERSVDEWDNTWPIATKRAVILASYDFHKTKGTRLALDRAFNQIGMTITTKEWFEYGGEPYRFTLFVNLDAVTLLNMAQYKQIVRVAFAVKNVRSFLERINIKRPGTPGPVYIVGYIQTSMTVKQTYDEVSDLTAFCRVYVGSSYYARTKTRVF